MHALDKTCTARQFEDPIRSLIWAFDDVRRHADVAYRLSYALYKLDLLVSRKIARQITNDERDRVLRAMVDATQAAITRLGKSYSRCQVRTGMGAAGRVFLAWAGSVSNDSNLRNPAFIKNCRDLCRILRNDMHNRSLLDDMAARMGTTDFRLGVSRVIYSDLEPTA